LFETEARLEAAQRALDLAKAELVTLKDERIDAASLEEELALALARRDALDVSAEELRQQLAAALAARKAAEARTAEQLTETEARDALLAQAKVALADQEAISLKAQREAELLNQQITALNQQLGELQALLDTRISADSRNKIQMATLGQDLNTALAQVAAQKAELARLAEARAAALEARNATLEGYQSEFFGRMREALADVEGLRIEGDRFVFDSAVLFESGSATVSFAGANEIKAVVDTLKLISQEIPNEIEWVIQVDGHTDNVPVTAGPFENNWELSQARALSVVRLLALLGIPPERLSANGFGEHQPIDTADTPEARASNRRIELKLTER
jgi:chemotaxis protein MotB